MVTIQIEQIKLKLKKVAWRKVLFWFFLITLILAVVASIGTVVLFAWYAKDLPNPARVVRKEGYATRVYDRNGKLLYDLYKDVKRNPVTWADVPESLKQATVAIEDKSFYEHKGFDPLTPLRIVKNLITKHRLVGGSTLTQQLVKNVLLTSERSVARKIKEFILAVQIDATYSKDEILLMYLNEAPYGGPLWGAGTASEQYFGKPLKNIDLAEAAILAGLPQRPNTYSPIVSKNLRAYVPRMETVLQQMVDYGYIDKETAQAASKEAAEYKFYESKTTLLSPHFVFWLKDDLVKRYGENALDLGLKVTSTLDLDLQDKVQEVVATEIDKAEKLGISNGAAVVLDPRDGQVLAMVGSRGYASEKTDGKFNVVTQALRQPGSAIKPITYALALRKGYSPASMIVDAPVVFPVVNQKDYAPNNYNGKFNGPLALRMALGNSINTTAVKMLATVGVENMLTQAYSMGISTLEPTAKNLSRFGLSLTLGGGEVKMIELAGAYSSFANGGVRVDPAGIMKVEDREGRVLENFQPSLDRQALSPQEAFLISHILQDNSAREYTFGAQNGLIIPNYQVAVKTGTTNDKRDNWAIGWTPNVLVATWVGNNDNSPMIKVASGVSGATPIWRRIMQAVLPIRTKEDFTIPSSIVSVEVDKLSGYRSHDGFPVRQDYFIDSQVPKIDDPVHMKLKVCKDKDGLAPPEDVANGNYVEKEYIKLAETDVWSKDGKNRWQEGIETWINQQPEGDRWKYRPPTGYCRSGGLVEVGFDNPGDRTTVGNNFDVNINPKSIKKIVEVKLWVNDVEKKTWSDKPFSTSLSLSDGKYKLKAKATDKDGNSSEREINIGVNIPWDWEPSPTPTITPVPTSTPIVPTNTPILVLPTATPVPPTSTPTP